MMLKSVHHVRAMRCLSLLITVMFGAGFQAKEALAQSHPGGSSKSGRATVAALAMVRDSEMPAQPPAPSSNSEATTPARPRESRYARGTRYLHIGAGLVVLGSLLLVGGLVPGSFIVSYSDCAAERCWRGIGVDALKRGLGFYLGLGLPGAGITALGTWLIIHANALRRPAAPRSAPIQPRALSLRFSVGPTGLAVSGSF